MCESKVQLTKNIPQKKQVYTLALQTTRFTKQRREHHSRGSLDVWPGGESRDERESVANGGERTHRMNGSSKH